ncbi:MAG TPA: ATP-binding protein [Myxococcaceae bacterium]
MNLQAWLLRRLDSLLTAEQRQVPPDELSRLRVLVGAAALNLVLAMLNVVGPEAPAHDTLFRTMGVCFSVAYLSVLLMSRRGVSRQRSALVLCSVLTLGIMLSTLTVGAQQAATHAVIMLIPVLAVYLLGPRLGFAFTLLMAVHVLLIYPLFQVRFDLTQPLYPDEQARLTTFAAIYSLLGGWLLSWLHSAARTEAHLALQNSERRLASLIESTDDLVCSFDAQGRLVTTNHAVRKLLHQATGSETLFELLLPQRQEFWREKLDQALAGQRQHFEVSASPEGKPLALDISLNPIVGVKDKPVGVTLFGRDITQRKEADVRLEELHRSLLEVSRQAGKAEVAVGVLHNVGNTLNSITVSTGLVAERARGLRLAQLARLSELLNEHAADLGVFFTTHPQGQKFPTYLHALSQQLSQEQAALVSEVDALRERVEHTRAVVAVQQEHARAAGLLEQVVVPQLLNDALRLHGAAFERLGAQVKTEYAPVPPVMVDRHKLLQILTNLLTNARYALEESPRPDKQLTLRVGPGSAGRLRIEVEDNGVGIPPENLPRIFNQGFTTREAGHGFGLHISSLTAREMGGALSCVSAGREQGATFTIEFPLEPVPA